MSRVIHACCWAGLLAVAVSGLRAGAQDPAEDPQQPPAKVGPKLPKDDGEKLPDIFWFNKDRSRPAAAAQVAGMGAPVNIVSAYGALALRLGGYHYVVWDELGFVSETAPELSSRWLREVRDGRWPPNLVAKAPDEIHSADWAFYHLYTQSMLFAYQVPVDAFRRSAKDSGNVTYAELMETADGRNQKFRGKVIAISGRLGQLRREKLIGAIVEKQGPREGYIGWVFGSTKHANPYCIQFPHLPDGLKPAEKMNQQVVFYGYFLGTIKYEGAPTSDNRARILTTPMLVGPTVIVEPTANAVAESPSIPVILVALMVAGGFLAFLTILFFVMYFLMARSDRNVLDTLAMIKQKHAEFAFEQSEAIQAVDGKAENGKPENGKPMIAPVVSAPPNGPVPSQLVGPESGTSVPEAKPVPPIALPVNPPAPPTDPQRN